MKTANRSTSFPPCLLAITLALAVAGISNAQTNFAISTPGGQYFYNVEGPDGPIPPQSDFTSPNFDLRAGNTYTLSIDTASFHPVDIITEYNFPLLDFAYDGASPQNVFHDVITLTIPATNYPSTLYYVCNQHAFYGQLNILPPIPDAPPQNLILSIAVSPTAVTITSTGTSTTYTLVPEFSSNLLSGPWLPVSTFTNNFVTGTNITTFDRLDPICGPNVFLRISQRPPQ